jgi:hypothetical protein
MSFCIDREIGLVWACAELEIIDTIRTIAMIKKYLVLIIEMYWITMI